MQKSKPSFVSFTYGIKSIATPVQQLLRLILALTLLAPPKGKLK